MICTSISPNANNNSWVLKLIRDSDHFILLFRSGEISVKLANSMEIRGLYRILANHIVPGPFSEKGW